MRNNERSYHSKYRLLPGATLGEAMKVALAIYHGYEKKTRRRVYIKSNNKSYFRGAKIFLDNYFPHLRQKAPRDRFRRIKLFRAGLDLVQNTHCDPIVETVGVNEVFMRFAGETCDGKNFFVQVRKNKKGNHYLMSTFPNEKVR